MTEPYTSTHIVQITDTTDRNARGKLTSAYAKHAGTHGLRDYQLQIEAARNTLDIGVFASELVHNTERADRILIAHNCAPAEKEDGTTNNHRSDFYYADLGDNVYAGGTINGLELSYLKGRIQKLFRGANTNSLNSQFRSLQVLPQTLVAFATPSAREDWIKRGIFEEVSDIDKHIADVPDTTHVIEVDEPFSNVKLWLSRDDRRKLRDGSEARILFGDISVEYGHGHTSEEPAFTALVRDKLFDVPLNTNVVALNSSSRVLGSQTVPMIATIRKRPAETQPLYTVPQVGVPVRLGLRAA